MKALFMHNTIPEYRMKFMKLLSEKVKVDFFITDISVAQKIYGIDASQDLIECNVICAKENKMRYFQLRRLLNKENYSIIVLPPSDDINQFMWGYSVICIARKRQIPCIYWTEKWEPTVDLQPFKKKIKNRIHRLMIAALAKNCSRCIAAGTQSEKYFRLINVNPEKIRVVFDSSTSPISNNKNVRKDYGIPDNAKVILYLGRVVERKGCLQLLQVFERIIKKYSDYYLIIGGTGDEYYTKCVDYVRKKEIHNVIFAGFIYPNERRDYYNAANVFVLPSFSLGGIIEAWGLTINEALECGTPVVATDCVGAAFDLLDGECGIMVKQNNLDDLQRGINKIIQSDEKTIRLSCIDNYSKYSVEKMANGFIEVFEEVLGENE